MALKTQFTHVGTSRLLGQRLVFFGNEQLATGVECRANILRSLYDFGHEIEALVLKGKPNKQPYAVEAFSEEKQIPVHWVETKNELIRFCDNFTSSIAVLASFGMLVPESVLNSFRDGIINVHPSLLPKYRGSSPLEQAILDDLSETGVSLMQLVKEMDEGPVLLQETISMPKKATKQQLYELIIDKVTTTLPETIVDAASGFLKASPQTGVPSYCPIIRKSDGLVSVETPASTIDNMVRAYAGWPKTKISFDSVDLLIHQSKIFTARTFSSKGLFIYDKNRLILSTIDGQLEIEKLQPTGKKIMDARSFINGFAKQLGLKHE